MLENLTLDVHDLSEVLAGALWKGPLEVQLRDAVRVLMAECLIVTAGVLTACDEERASTEVFDTAAGSPAVLSDPVAATEDTWMGQCAKPGLFQRSSRAQLENHTVRPTVQPLLWLHLRTPE